MKSYTDLEQSKKLAEILPLESADMTYSALVEGIRDKMSIKGWEVNVGLNIAIKENFFSYRNGYMFPCWSLAALMELMPNTEDITTTLGKGAYDFSNEIPEHKDIWGIEYEDETDLDNYVSHFITADTAIDAAVEMIIWLKENNLI